MLDLMIALTVASTLALAGVFYFSLYRRSTQMESECASLEENLTRTRNMLRAERLQYQRKLDLMNSRTCSRASYVNIRLTYPSRIQVWEIYPDGYLKVCYFGTLSQAQEHIKNCLTIGVNTILLHSKYLTKSPPTEPSLSSSEPSQDDTYLGSPETETGSSKSHTQPPEQPYNEGLPSSDQGFSPIPTSCSGKLTEALSIGNYPKDVEEIRQE